MLTSPCHSELAEESTAKPVLQTRHNNWEDMGTYNYMSPIDYWLDHCVYDLDPYYNYGNVPETERK